MKDSVKKKIRRTVSAAAALCMTLMCTAGAYAENKEKPEGVDKFIDAMNKMENRMHKWCVTDDEYHNSLNLLCNYVVDSPYIEEEELPERYDLRNVNGKCYVPEVENQTPYGTCWAYAVTASSVISIASHLDIDFNTASEEQKKALDFSEKHLAWFFYHPLPEDNEMYPDQAGEGYYLYCLEELEELSDEEREEVERSIYNYGGYPYGVGYLFSAGMGPVTEEEVPYINDEDSYRCILDLRYHKDGELYNCEVIFDEVLTGEELGEFLALRDEYKAKYEDYSNVFWKAVEPEDDKPYCQSYILTNIGDWSLSEDQRFLGSQQLTNVNFLPSPALIDKDLSYMYNELGTLAIKKEICKGNGVTVSIKTDYSVPGQKVDLNNCFLKFSNLDGSEAKGGKADIWAQYVFDTEYDPDDPDSVNHTVLRDHAVTIVGYDDNFPKEYFNDPKGLIPANGAFIVRNTWGSEKNSDPTAVDYWGNGGDGYFYVSYYDQSLSEPMTFEFKTDYSDGIEAIGMDMYDLTPDGYTQDTLTFSSDVYASNVFKAEEDESVRYIGVSTASPNCTVKYTVYLLDDDFKDPTDGEKVIVAEDSFDYAGYHMIDMGQSVVVRKGQSYSVVINTVREDGKRSVITPNFWNESGTRYYEEIQRENYIKKHGSDEDFIPNPNYTKTVINPGESFIGVKTDSGVEWADYTDILKAVTADNDELNDNGISYDNFNIRSYPQQEVVILRNELTDAKDRYSEGDVLKGAVRIKNTAIEDLYDLELTLSLGDSAEKHKTVKRLRSGEERTIEYSYRITGEDVDAGELTSAVGITMGGTPILAVEGVTVDKVTVSTRPSSAASDVMGEFDADDDEAGIIDMNSAAESSAAPDNSSVDTNPATGTSLTALIGLMGLSAASAFAAGKRKKK